MVQEKLDAIALQFPVQARFTEPVVTSLPTTGQDGQIIVYQADATNGVRWQFQYNASSASSSKWEFVGGPPLFAEIAPGDQSTASTSYTALATAGPSIALPLVGDYDVEIGVRAFNASAGSSAVMSYAIGATAASDNDAYSIYVASGSTDTQEGSRVRRKTALTAVTLTAQYRAGSGTAHFDNRWMRVLPVRV